MMSGAGDDKVEVGRAVGGVSIFIIFDLGRSSSPISSPLYRRRLSLACCPPTPPTKIAAVSVRRTSSSLYVCFTSSWNFVV